MANIRSRHTKPEIIVRSIVHRLGCRFRLHDPKLPGKPDIVLARHRTIIRVHGCFWHMHNCKRGDVTPKTNVHYWQSKRLRTTLRDQEYKDSYEKAGWTVITIWECELRDIEKVNQKIKLGLTTEC